MPTTALATWLAALSTVLVACIGAWSALRQHRAALLQATETAHAQVQVARINADAQAQEQLQEWAMLQDQETRQLIAKIAALEVKLEIEIAARQHVEAEFAELRKAIEAAGFVVGPIALRPAPS